MSDDADDGVRRSSRVPKPSLRVSENLATSRNEENLRKQLAKRREPQNRPKLTLKKPSSMGFTPNQVGANEEAADNIRDWLNVRMAPFLKQAITQALEDRRGDGWFLVFALLTSEDRQVLYPLQWLGEQLILQSVQYEGNPDVSNIRERFLYEHRSNNGRVVSAPTETIDVPVEALQKTVLKDTKGGQQDSVSSPLAETRLVTS